MCLEEMLPHPKALPCFESNGWLCMFRLGIPSTASCWESGVSTGGRQPVIFFCFAFARTAEEFVPFNSRREERCECLRALSSLTAVTVSPSCGPGLMALWAWTSWGRLTTRTCQHCCSQASQAGLMCLSRVWAQPGVLPRLRSRPDVRTRAPQ